MLLQAKTNAQSLGPAHLSAVPSPQEMANFLRDEIGSAEQIEKLTTVEVERVHLIAQGYAVPTDAETLRLELLYRCATCSPHTRETLNDWLLAPREDGPAPWMLIRTGRREELEALLV